MLKSCTLILLLCACLSFGQANTWTKVTDSVIGERNFGALVYLPQEQGFLFSMGYLDERNPHSYSEVLYSMTQNRWINFLPAPALYGVWADSMGYAYGNGLSTHTTFGSYYFIFKEIAYNGTNYLRPSLLHHDSRSYYQYALNTDNGKIYYYMANKTFTYDPQTRRWDTLSTATHPAAYQGGTVRLWWGAMCYDPHNHEILLFGGGGIDAENSRPGTWTFIPATTTWTKLNLAVEPGPRANSPMVYDPINNVIVLFGGDHLDYLYSDTWVYDCATKTWAQKSPSVCPYPRAGHAFLYLPKSQKIVLVGGYEYSELSTYGTGQYKNRTPFEIWTYDPAADQWTLVKAFTSGTVPSFRNGWAGYPAVAAADTGDRILVMADYNKPTTYLLSCDPAQTDPSGTQTYGVTPGTHDLRTGPYSPGWYYQNVGTANPDSFETFLKNLPTNQWTSVTPPKDPCAGYTLVDRVWGTTIYDPDRNYILVWAGGHSSHGGTDVARYETHNNRWYTDQYGDWPLEATYSNTSYPSHFTFNNRPFMTGHTYDNYDYDVNLKKMVLVKTKYTYVYDPDRGDWDSLRILNHAEMAGGFYNTSVTSTPHGAVCWTYKTGTSSSIWPYLLFRLDNGQNWVKLNTTGEDVPRYYTDVDGAVYDSKRDRMLFMGSSVQTGQIWALDMQTLAVTKLNPTGSYGSNSYWREIVYLPAQDKVLVQGGRWYDCASNTWSATPFTSGPGVGSLSSVSSGLMYDPSRDLVWSWENPELAVLRVAGGYNPDSLPPVKLETAGASEEVFQASPNPLNPATAIRFSIKTDASATLSIYTVDGKLVRTLLNEKTLKAGRHQVAWHGSDSRGNRAGSGVYLCVLKIGNSRQMLKLTLLK